MTQRVVTSERLTRQANVADSEAVAAEPSPEAETATGSGGFSLRRRSDADIAAEAAAAEAAAKYQAKIAAERAARRAAETAEGAALANEYRARKVG